ncbi:FeoA family protein [Pseudothermotoga thermarum]|uniref:FeoA family protein n=1 Tax=Pseudothermotoga thermarum DSM 5069 TaxID=688269 RepID=F7YY28_9THEM|nr:FeoA family protein [Pseudothermotoga thermarum]AEH50838.1 FeoA family protein [Pseudothermotoga thermarum DSM 5069]
MTLAEVPVGFYAKVKALKNHPLANKLAAMGFAPNSNVKVVNEAPLGDPKIYLIKDKLIALRNSDASLIEVELLEEVLPLSLAQEGVYEVVGIDIPKAYGLKRRFSDLGINEGARILVDSHGNVTTLDGKHIRIGKGMASRVFVRRVQE